MPTSISILINNVQFTGELNDSPTARAILEQLPLKIQMSRWGDEYYGTLPKELGLGLAPEAREEMAIAELAWWPPGNALCIFFGPTPVSREKEPRAASPVNPVGMLTGNLKALRAMGPRVSATIAMAAEK